MPTRGLVACNDLGVEIVKGVFPFCYCNQIEALEASLEVTRKEVAAARHEVTSEEKRKRRTFEGEVTALKVS